MADLDGEVRPVSPSGWVFGLARDAEIVLLRRLETSSIDNPLSKTASRLDSLDRAV